MKDRDYIDSKLRHLKRSGINAVINPATGAVTTDQIMAERDAIKKRVEYRKKLKNKQ
jgi:hypothetical protein